MNNLQETKFGVMFDIDGVLMRGKSVIPAAKDAIKKLMDSKKFKVPTVFCTNSFGLQEVKAELLSNLLGVQIAPDQIVMSQTPLESFQEYHDKLCLVSGPSHDGGVIQVAKKLGFKNIITIDEVRKAYPYLDWVDRERWPKEQIENDKSFPRIEAVVLLGEPIRWETSLQLIIDILVTNGKPSCSTVVSNKQLPILAVNMDLQWMAKAEIPRFGHGAFLLCLENLYTKITGKQLKYEALVGKPGVVTYEYSYKVLSEQASKMGLKNISKIYAIGDNQLTDIYGANIFNRHLKRNSIDSNNQSSTKSPEADLRCCSILVCTGIYQKDQNNVKDQLDHGHRDFPYCETLTQPNYVVDDVDAAIEKIFEIEQKSN